MQYLFSIFISCSFTYWNLRAKLENVIFLPWFWKIKEQITDTMHDVINTVSIRTNSNVSTPHLHSFVLLWCDSLHTSCYFHWRKKYSDTLSYTVKFKYCFIVYWKYCEISLNAKTHTKLESWNIHSFPIRNWLDFLSIQFSKTIFEWP